ncbi:MAG: L-aspartate oxidase [Acidimicrobiales bacterium]|jgi:L-aspartate oxidase
MAAPATSIAQVDHLDVLVVGSGVAGLSAAVRLASLGRARVGILTKGTLEQSTTRWAQGGIAAVLPGDEDSTDRHLADTLRAGAGLCDEAAVRVLVDEGPARVTELIALGAVFDRSPDGDLARALEGGHSSPRVLHAGGTATGAEVERALVEAVEESAAAVLEHWYALDLVVAGGRCRGVLALDPTGAVVRVPATHVILACGGAGQLFSVTTNPDEATGDGIAMALRAGVLVTDVEFVQFHPTALHHPVMPRPLISEALRGHGAVLRDERGERFVDELQPRDVVSRAIAAELARSGASHVWLDCTKLPEFAHRFPTIHAALSEAGYDPGREWLPIAPAAHYISGGVATDLDGASVLPGLWAAGEVACTGVHGANRLASNSLLEGMVFGARVVDAIIGGKDAPGSTGILSAPPGALPIEQIEVAGGLSGSSTGSSNPPATAATDRTATDPADLAHRQAAATDGRRRLQTAMTADAGIVRDAASLARATRNVEGVLSGAGDHGAHGDHGEQDEHGLGHAPLPAEAELRNLRDLSLALLAAATAREESRGAHTRSDYQETSERFAMRFGFGSDGPEVRANVRTRVSVASAAAPELGVNRA